MSQLRSATLVLLLLASCRQEQGRPGIAIRADTSPLERWVRAGSYDSFADYFDTQTIVRTDTASWKVWLRRRYTTSQPPAAFSHNKRYSMVLDQVEFDCVRHRQRFWRGVYYDSSGAIVQDAGLPPGAPDPDWDDLIPGSIAERIKTSVCARAPAPSRLGRPDDAPAPIR